MPLAETFLVRIFWSTGRALAKFWYWSITWDQRWKNRKGIIVGESEFERSTKRQWVAVFTILIVAVSLFFYFRSK